MATKKAAFQKIEEEKNEKRRTQKIEIIFWR